MLDRLAICPPIFIATLIRGWRPRQPPTDAASQKVGENANLGEKKITLFGILKNT